MLINFLCILRVFLCTLQFFSAVYEAFSALYELMSFCLKSSNLPLYTTNLPLHVTDLSRIPQELLRLRHSMDFKRPNHTLQSFSAFFEPISVLYDHRFESTRLSPFPVSCPLRSIGLFVTNERFVERRGRLVESKKKNGS